MDAITARLCHLVDFDIERRLKTTLGYQVEENEYPAWPVATKELVEIYSNISNLFVPTTKVLTIFDFGSGIGNVLMSLYNAAVADDYQCVKVVGIEKYIQIINKAKEYLNHCNIPENNYLFYGKDLKTELPGFMQILKKRSISETKFDQNVVFLNMLFRETDKQSALELEIIKTFPKNTVFVFYMGIHCSLTSVEALETIGLKQITHQIFIKTK